jgi:hypothetical protein
MQKTIVQLIVSHLSCLLCQWMLTATAHSADNPTRYLKGVAVIWYEPIFELSKQCSVDFKAWDTALEFVANQSIKLKLIRSIDHYNKMDELLSKRHDQESIKELADWSERFQREVYVPYLHFGLFAIELETGCVAVMNAEVKARLKPSSIISTGVVVYDPDHQIWSTRWQIKTTHQLFSKTVIEVSEQIIKGLVNDWTASQNIP